MSDKPANSDRDMELIMNKVNEGLRELFEIMMSRAPLSQSLFVKISEDAQVQYQEDMLTPMWEEILKGVIPFEELLAEWVEDGPVTPEGESEFLKLRSGPEFATGSPIGTGTLQIMDDWIRRTSEELRRARDFRDRMREGFHGITPASLEIPNPIPGGVIRKNPPGEMWTPPATFIEPRETQTTFHPTLPSETSRFKFPTSIPKQSILVWECYECGKRLKKETRVPSTVCENGFICPECVGHERVITEISDGES